MANHRPTLHTGMTNNLIKRVWQHKQVSIVGFTKKYHLYKLVYYEIAAGELQAIVREKQIKDMDRQNNLEMVRQFNPGMDDLYESILDSGQARMT